MKQNILGKEVDVKVKTLVEARIKIYSNDFFNECFPNFTTVVIDSTARPVTQSMLEPATNLEIVAAVEACQLVPGFSENQLAYFLIENRWNDELFIVNLVDKVRDETDEADSFISERGERLVLRTVEFIWNHRAGGAWSLSAYRISNPNELNAGRQVLSLKPLVS